MAVTRDLKTIARDLVMKTLDGLAERAATTEAAPEPVHQLAERWRTLSESDREDLARRIGVAVEAALAVIPLAAAAAVTARRRAKKRRAAPAPKAAAVTAETAGDGKKKGKDDKNRRKEKKKKDRKKDKKDKKKKKSKR